MRLRLTLLNAISYMEALAPELKNASTRVGITMANSWTWYRMLSHPADDRSIYKGQVFGSKEEVVHVVKILSIKSHRHYHVYK